MNTDQKSRLHTISLLSMAVFLAGIHSFVKPQTIRVFNSELGYANIVKAIIASLAIVNGTMYITIQKEIKLQVVSDRFKTTLKRFYILSTVFYGVFLTIMLTLFNKLDSLSIPEYVFLVVPAWLVLKSYKWLKNE